ncbi:hypothetical protein ACSMXN_23415 [Jatrophihabitans sp. DSM 45814]
MSPLDIATRDDGLPATGDPPPTTPGGEWPADNWSAEDLHADWQVSDPRTEVMPVDAALTSTIAPALPSQSAAQHLVCPECGTSAMVTVNRRESMDFCRKCDYPLFWVPSRVELDRSSTTATESLRRLPGTAGRATVASVPCPHCAEPNTVTAQTCVRCGQPMIVVAPPTPPPTPVYRAPEPEPVVEIYEKPTPWWVWVLLFGTLAVIAALVAYGVVRRYG